MKSNFLSNISHVNILEKVKFNYKGKHTLII